MEDDADAVSPSCSSRRLLGEISKPRPQMNAMNIQRQWCLSYMHHRCPARTSYTYPPVANEKASPSQRIYRHSIRHWVLTSSQAPTLYVHPYSQIDGIMQPVPSPVHMPKQPFCCLRPVDRQHGKLESPDGCRDQGQQELGEY